MWLAMWLWFVFGLGVWAMLNDAVTADHKRYQTWLVIIAMLLLWPIWLTAVAFAYVAGAIAALWNWSRR